MRNRFVRSATYDGMSDLSGQVTESQLKLISDLAEGGVGLIISGIMYVHPSGQISSFMNSIAEDKLVHGLRKLTAKAHEHGAKWPLNFITAAVKPALSKPESSFPLRHPSLWMILTTGEAIVK